MITCIILACLKAFVKLSVYLPIQQGAQDCLGLALPPCKACAPASEGQHRPPYLQAVVEINIKYSMLCTLL